MISLEEEARQLSAKIYNEFNAIYKPEDEERLRKVLTIVVNEFHRGFGTMMRTFRKEVFTAIVDLLCGDAWEYDIVSDIRGDFHVLLKWKKVKV